MEFDLPFSREEILSGGLQGRRAMRLLSLIENRTSYLMAQVQRAVNILLEGKSQASFGGDNVQQLLAEATESVTIDELEHYAPQWADLIAPEPTVQATVAHLLAQKYTFTYEGVPAIREALALDSLAVKQAYSAQYGKPLARLFAEEVAFDAEAVDSQKELLFTIESLLSWLYLEKGETLFEEGDIGDGLYILMYGRLGVIIKQDDGSLKTVSEMGPGDIFGEMALITGARRSATVMAVRDTMLLKLTQADFERLAERHPQVMMQIARIQAERVRRLSYKRPHRTTLITLAVLPISQEVPLAEFCDRLVTAFASSGSTLYLNSQRLDEALQRRAAETEFDAPENSSVVAWLSEQEMRYRFVIYQSDTTLNAWTKRCIRQADHILLVGWGNASPALSEIELQLGKMSNVRQSLLLLHPERCQQPPVGTSKWLDVRQVQRHHHLRMREADFARLVRVLTGRAICLVLGSGAARGFAHVGVVRALEELGVEIDIAGGTSFGAMIAGLVAMGMDYQTMYSFAKELANPKQIFDYTLPIASVFKGRKFTTILKNLFGEVYIEDNWREFFCIATNLTRSKEMVYQRGPLWKYVRASASLPLAFPPIVDQGNLLVDGALVNMVPVDVMSEIYQGLIIGVDLSLEEDMSGDYNFGSNLSGWQLLWRRLNPWQPKIIAPSFAATLLRIIELSSINRKAKQPHYADLYLRPPINDIELLDFGSYDKTIEIGYQSALPQLEAWLKQERVKRK